MLSYLFATSLEVKNKVFFRVLWVFFGGILLKKGKKCRLSLKNMISIIVHIL